MIEVAHHYIKFIAIFINLISFFLSVANAHSSRFTETSKSFLTNRDILSQAGVKLKNSNSIKINMEKCVQNTITESLQRFICAFDTSVFTCSMSSFTKIRASINFHTLKTLSICPVVCETNSEAKWVKFSNNLFYVQHMSMR